MTKLCELAIIMERGTGAIYGTRSGSLRQLYALAEKTHDQLRAFAKQHNIGAAAFDQGGGGFRTAIQCLESMASEEPMLTARNSLKRILWAVEQSISKGKGFTGMNPPPFGLGAISKDDAERTANLEMHHGTPLAPKYKCDETRPICTNCTVAERVCDYGSRKSATPIESLSPQASSQNTPPARVTLQLDPTSVQDDVHTAATDQKADAGSDVNLNHMELMIHYSLDISAPELDDDAISFGTKLLLSKALDAPWLLYETLAISARHLAVVKPGNSAFYLTTSMQLQTRAIEMFNSARLHIDESNCVAALMFSSTLARHVLADTLASQDLDAGTFIQHYLRYVQIHRGLRAIASSAWPHIADSDLHVFLSRAEGLDTRPTRGRELEALRQLVLRSPRLDAGAREACLAAIRYLQLGLDGFADSGSDSDSRQGRYQLVFIWSLLTTPAFTELVREHRPEALVILGHYAVLLHYARSLWQIGTSGAFLFQSVCELLPDTEEWARHLCWPRTIIKGS
ncbi:hypothetical protein SLS62_010707 [Diatrype stigma]|uniref:Uncharacterized protein n=1 Tax=Diatrype stigma TaxID=117547 RepID=A0AAN9YHQ2_9PEZI